MAKELPYFKFEPAEYLTKNISFCSLPAQGLFINICSYYWQRNCSLTKDQLLRRLNYEIEFNELVEEGIIDLLNENITIKFLDAQLKEVELKSTTNSLNGSKGGRPRKNPIKTETKANALKSESETKGIREDKIKENEINIEFFNELLNSESWLEVNAKNNKISVLKTKEYLKIFGANLTAQMDKKVNKKDYASHFARWLPLEVEKDKSKPKSNQNQNLI